MTEQTLSKPRLFVQYADEFSGYIDYYSGHGHALEKAPSQGGPIACITLQVWPTNQSTWPEIGNELLKDNSTEFEDLTENESLDREKADAAIRAFILQTYVSHDPIDREFRPFSDWEDPTENQIETPTYLIVLHVYQGEDA